MTYSTARFCVTRSVDYIADYLAEAMLRFDPEAKKIEDKIAEHREAIRKLEVKLGKRRVELSKVALPNAEKKKEEAKNIVELHDKMELEFEKQLRANKAL